MERKFRLWGMRSERKKRLQVFELVGDLGLAAKRRKRRFAGKYEYSKKGKGHLFMRMLMDGSNRETGLCFHFFGFT